MLHLLTLDDRLGAHPLVSTFIMSIQREDAVAKGIRGVRYEDTWDASLVFDYWLSQPPSTDLPYEQLLDKAISLSRVRLCSRSSNVATMWIGERPGLGRCVDFQFDERVVARLPPNSSS
eukprot:SAG31_NODE_5_length_43735_cov_42.922266_2_plen_119_part_00